jgi:tetratricopeptide (TPR) repeat protein
MRISIGNYQQFCSMLLVAVAFAGCKSDKAAVQKVEAVSAEESARVSLEHTETQASQTQVSSSGLPSMGEVGDSLDLHAVVACEADPTDPDAVLELAGDHYRRGAFAAANACAQVATDLVPQAVEAQHLRAAALTGLARYDEAQVAFAMALVLDPDDPETLADVADFFINILPPKRRQTVEVGLEYARRGSQRAIARRRQDQGLQGRLLLLEAEALNDLGEPDRALARVEEALEFVPGLARAEHELAVSLFNLLRFDESEKVFLDLLSQSSADAYAHYHLGLILERTGREADAEAHFLRARTLAPDEFLPPVIISKEDFRAEVAKAIAELPPELGTLVMQTTVELVDVPLEEDLRGATPPFTPTILGLFRGLPIGLAADPEGEGADIPPRSLVLYRKNLGRAVRSRAELNRQIRKTLRHEIGHLQGYDEDELRRRGLE